jgi:hypothetical protein
MGVALPAGMRPSDTGTAVAVLRSLRDKGIRLVGVSPDMRFLLERERPEGRA